MGEVYEARDTRLDRSVAIKVLPAHVSADPERRARFEREAKTIAAGAGTGTLQRRQGGLRIVAVVAGAFPLIGVGAGLMALLRPPAPKPSLARVSLGVRPAEELNAGGVRSFYLPIPGGSRTALAWAPDGQTLVFVGHRDGVQSSTCGGSTPPRHARSRAVKMLRCRPCPPTGSGSPSGREG